MPIDGGAAAELATVRDPVDRRCLRELLGHSKMGRLQDTVGDPEGDPVDEEPLPEGERRGRRLLEAWEVGEIAAKGLPALRLDVPGPRAAAPELPLRERPEHDRGVHEGGDGQAEEHDVVPARVHRAPAVDGGIEEQRPDRGEREQGEHERYRSA